jgi:hypothetical protein
MPAILTATPDTPTTSRPDRATFARADSEHPRTMGDQRRDQDDDGFIESTVRDATITGTEDDPEPPDEPQAATAMPRNNAGPDEDQ